MKLQCRLTHNLVEISVDETNTTVFKSDPREVEEMIENLSSVIEDLAKLLNKQANIIIDEYPF